VTLDWFERITGFREEGYGSTKARLRIDDEELVSLVNGSRHGIGRLGLLTLRELRQREAGSRRADRRTTVTNLVGDVRALHREPALAGAVFQVASQFNLLEMVSPNVSPEDGVTRYMHDRTQGPACAMAAGAATIFRNYFAPMGDAEGQTSTRQLDALAPLGAALSARLGRPVHSLWAMRNGYALCTPDGLSAIGTLLRDANEDVIEQLSDELCVGVHEGAEVTDGAGPARPRVTQVFCSALPVSYTRIPMPAWEPFARLVLEAAYEATLLAACACHRAGGSSTVLLTRLGGGAFGNADAWIDTAIERGLARVASAGLDVRLVHFGEVPASMAELARRHDAA
jgi:hypothetical protein